MADKLEGMTLDEIAAVLKERDLLRKVVEAQEHILVGYRTGRRPPDGVFDVLSEWRKNNSEA